MRIVSLCPSLTELVFDLGRGSDLVAVTDFCVHPASGVADLERIGGTKTPRVERIVELGPDLVLLNEEENRAEDAKALGAAGLHCHVTHPRNLEETAAMVRSIGRAVECTEEGDRIAREIEERAAATRGRAAARARVRFAYLIWRDPWMTVNADTYVHSLLALAGGINVFADLPDRYPAISTADLLDGQPEVVLLGSEPFPFSERHVGELADATGWPRRRFALVDGEYLSWHGSRTPAGIDYAERVLLDLRAHDVED